MSPALDAVVMRALARDPNDRFGSAAEMRAAILAPAASAPRGGRPRRHGRRRHHGFGAARRRPDHLGTTAPPTRTRRPLRVAATTPPAHLPRLAAPDPARAAHRRLHRACRRARRRARSRARRPRSRAAPEWLRSARSARSTRSATARNTTAKRGLRCDGQPSTAWHTETYASRDFGGAKAGVGLAITLDDATRLDQLHVSSPTQGWAADGLRCRRQHRRRSTAGARRSRARRTSAATPPSTSTARAVEPSCCGSPRSATPPYRAQIDELSITT